MKLRCAVLDDYQQVAAAMADWSAVSADVEVRIFHEHIADQAELAQVLAPFDIIVAMRERTPFQAALLERLPQLKLLITTGMRNASIDMEAAAARGIRVSGTGGAGAGTAELTWALILGLARQLEREQGELRSNGRWQSTVGADLYGRRLGVIGLGKVGTAVARVGQAFGMEVSAWSPNLTVERAQAAGVRYADKEQLLRESDVVTIHLVLAASTRGLIGARELALLQPTAYLINTSRAPIVDQAALVAALQAGRFAGAGLDVFEPEPLPADHPFRTLPNVLATPHIGYVTEQNYRKFYADIVENIAAYVRGEPLRCLNGA